MSIEVKGVTKQYGKTFALEDVSLKLEEGKIYGLLGRNGAGKTTLLNLLTNRIFADAGEITLDGLSAVERDEAQRKIYFVGEQSLFPSGIRMRDAMLWTQRFYPEFDTAQAKRLADRFGLDTKKKLETLSTGYRSIAKLILALSVNTPYVFLDEPVLGLDAGHREQFYQELLEVYGKRPRTYVISTHLIEEVSAVIEHVVILRNGRVLKDQPAESLREMGYTVSGVSQAVDQYLTGREVLGVDTLGGLKSAYLLGKPDREGAPAGLEFGGLELQKLFIELTREGGRGHE